MPITLSPTFAFILDHGAEVYLDCASCRALVAVDLPRLAKAFGRSCRIDDAPIGCPKCGKLGTPWVTGKGNMLVGHKHYWPPTPHHELTESD